MGLIGFRRVLAAVLIAATFTAALPAAPARAATYSVNSTADPGDGVCDNAECTLREAIDAANLSAGADTITFAIPTATIPVIAPLTGLPAVTGPLTIDGTSQQAAGWVALDGASLTPRTTQSGLELAGGGSVVRGLIIRTFPGSGIRISGPGGNIVAGNRIGTDLIGGFWVLRSNRGSGVLISGSPGNTIGGTAVADRNILSGNAASGVTVDADSPNTAILGNYIGLGGDGTSDVRNDLGGVRIASATNTVRGNVISANNLIGADSHGVVLDGAAATGNVVAGNLIGPRANGTAGAPNVGTGVLVRGGASSNIIGGPQPADRNVISNNREHGVHVAGLTSAGNVIEGNYIGLAPDGATAMPNGTAGSSPPGAGIFLSNLAPGTGTTGANTVQRNVVSGNIAYGISVLRAPGAHSISNNLVGLTADGLAPVPNTSVGLNVYLDESPVTAAMTIVGNTISGNAVHGLYLYGLGGATLRGNRIGLAATGQTLAGNGGSGIVMLAGANNTVHGNEIAGNGDGVFLGASGGGSGSTGNTLSENVIRANGGAAVMLNGAPTAANRVLQGSLTGHPGKGIALLGGANGGIQPPAITSVDDGDGFVVRGTALSGALVQVYADPDDEGRDYLGQTTASALGAWTISSWTYPDMSAVASAVRAGTLKLHGTQTDANNNTSELSQGQAESREASGVAQYRETSDGIGVATLLLGGATVTVRTAGGLQDTTTANATTGAYSFNELAGNTAHVATYDLTAPTGRRYLVSVPFTTNAVGGAAIPPPAPVFNRKNHGWLTAFRIVDGVPVPDQISREGQATWYRLAIAPQTQVTINVTGCTFDCNVVVYRDLFQVAAALKAGSLSLSGIRTDLAGNIAADDMDADDMDADDMDADDMDADDMDADDMDADDMDADDMDADDMDADDMDADDMDADDMDADDMDADDMDADNDGLTGYGPVYLAAQRKGVRAASVSEGLAPETITINTRSLTGDLFIRVKGDTVTDVGTFTVSAMRAPQASCVGAPLIARAPSTPAGAIPSGKRSLILTDSSAFAPADRAQVLAKLGALAQHATVNGHVLDLATDANIAALRADWLATPTCVAQANLLTDAIRGLVQLARARGPLEYLIIGGGDRIVPFRREADWAEISRESRYSPPVLGSSPSDASLVSDTILTDDFYATATPIERVNRTLYLPDLAVGRLVESAQDIGAYVDMYIAQNGRAAPTTALSSGYDFNLDLAQYVTTQLQSRGLAVNASLVSNTWSADQWRATVLGTTDRFGILSLQGHFSANRLVPADNGQRVLSTEIAGLADGRFRGALVYSLGCHSGYSISDPDALQGLTQPVAFPEAFLRQGATLVGGTGYQYGETVLMKNTEALIALLTTELGYSTDARGIAYGAAGVPIGKALMYAKRAYMGDTATPRGIDFKVVGVSTVYGSPTMSFALPSPVARPQPGTVSPAATAIAGLGVLDQTTATSLTRVGAAGTPSYYTGASGTTVAPYRPIAPLVTIPAEAAGSVLAGVVFMGGVYTEESGFVPQLSIPATEESGEAPRYVNDTFSPTRPVRTNLFDGDAVQLIPFQYRSDATGTAGTARVFGDVRYRAYYSSVTGPAAIVDAPPIERVSVTVVPAGIEVRASVRGHTLAGIADVYVTYTDTSAASRSFASVQMTAVLTVSDGAGFSGFTREYTALIPAGANAAAIRFMVQAVSGTGRVEVAANGGQLFSILTGTGVSTPAVAPMATQLSIAATPQAPAYRSPLVASAVLSGLPAGQLAGRAITFSFGGVAKSALTDNAGAASATFHVQVVPGTHQLTASYAGGTGVLGSAASTAVQVQRAAAMLTVTPASVRAPAGVVIARLTAGGVTLNEQPIVLRVGSRSLATATDFAGDVRFETVDFPRLMGLLDVTVEYPGNPRYLATSATVPVTVSRAAFVTAGGWLETAGATGVPTDTRANITLEARVDQKQSVPTGKVQVQVKGSIDFRSTTIASLDVADDTAVLAGEGTVNGRSGYRYLVEVVDAASDTVSVRIWDATGSATSPTHAIAGTLKGGTVKIHH